MGIHGTDHYHISFEIPRASASVEGQEELPGVSRVAESEFPICFV